MKKILSGHSQKLKKMIFLFWIFVLRIEAKDDYPSYNLCKIFDEDMFAKMLPDMGLGKCEFAAR